MKFSFMKEREDWERNRFMGEIKDLFRTCEVKDVCEISR